MGEVDDLCPGKKPGDKNQFTIKDQSASEINCTDWSSFYDAIMSLSSSGVAKGQVSGRWRRWSKIAKCLAPPPRPPLLQPPRRGNFQFRFPSIISSFMVIMTTTCHCALDNKTAVSEWPWKHRSNTSPSHGERTIKPPS